MASWDIMSHDFYQQTLRPISVITKSNKLLNYFINVTNCSFILTEKAKTRIIVILYEDSIDMVAMYTCVLPSLIPVIVETKLGLYLLQKYKENQCSK